MADGKMAPPTSTRTKAPLAPPLAIALCGPAVGIAEGAIRDFIGYVPGRTNPHLRGAAQIDSPLTHQTVAEAKAKVASAASGIVMNGSRACGATKQLAFSPRTAACTISGA